MSTNFNPYGGLISSSGPLAGANTMRFSSKTAILSTTGAWGFYDYGFRFHDPGMQRWLNRDPLGETGARLLQNGRPSLIGDGANALVFLRNDPIAHIDGFGLKRKSVLSLILGGLTGCRKAPNWSPPSAPGNCAEDPDYQNSIKKWFDCKSDSGDGSAECTTICGCIAGQTSESEGACNAACTAKYGSRCK